MRNLSLALVCFTLMLVGRANADTRFHAHTEFGRKAARVVEISHQLRDFVSPQDYADILLPVIKSSGRALAVTEANGEPSGTARPYCMDLLKQLENARPFIMDLMAAPVTEDAATELLTISAEIRRMMD